jgi:hypothetical protein
VALDMQNNFNYQPLLNKCHLLHFNDNKYRFQSRRMKHQYDKGDVTAVNPMALFFSNDSSAFLLDHQRDYPQENQATNPKKHIGGKKKPSHPHLRH